MQYSKFTLEDIPVISTALSGNVLKMLTLSLSLCLFSLGVLIIFLFQMERIMK